MRVGIGRGLSQAQQLQREINVRRAAGTLTFDDAADVAYGLTIALIAALDAVAQIDNAPHVRNHYATFPRASAGIIESAVDLPISRLATTLHVPHLPKVVSPVEIAASLPQ